MARKFVPSFHLGPANYIGLAGSLLLHLAWFAVAHHDTPKGMQYQRGDATMQTTFFVGLHRGDTAPRPQNPAAPSDAPPSGNSKDVNGAGILGNPLPAADRKRSELHVRDQDLSRYVSPNLLDGRPMASSDPDYRILDGLPNTHQPIKLRLYIDESGTVADIGVLQEDERDDAVALRARAMFSLARFIPGRIQQRYVASYVDIVIDLDDHPEAPPEKLVNHLQ